MWLPGIPTLPDRKSGALVGNPRDYIVAILASKRLSLHKGRKEQDETCDTLFPFQDES